MRPCLSGPAGLPSFWSPSGTPFVMPYRTLREGVRVVVDPRFNVVRPVPRPHARRSLICFGFAGGGTAGFRSWGDVLPVEIELALVRYPGREGRFNTPFAKNWNDLMSDVMAAVLPLTSRDYVLFGHSFGARVAFDAAVRIAASGISPPRAVVVSGSRAPMDHQQDSARTPRPDDTDDVLHRWMNEVGQVSEKVLAEPDLRRMALDLLRADLRVSHSYRYRAGTSVSAPLRVLYGTSDATVDRASAERWRLAATGDCRLEPLPGGHFYTDAVWSRLPDRIGTSFEPAPV